MCIFFLLLFPIAFGALLFFNDTHYWLFSSSGTSAQGIFIASASTACLFYFVDENLFTVFLFLIFIVAITALFKFVKRMSRLYFQMETKFWC